MPDTRANLLHSLLCKRATAHGVGDEQLESLLRDQIRWALPMVSNYATAVTAMEN